MRLRMVLVGHVQTSTGAVSRMAKGFVFPFCIRFDIWAYESIFHVLVPYPFFNIGTNYKIRT